MFKTGYLVVSLCAFSLALLIGMGAAWGADYIVSHEAIEGDGYGCGSTIPAEYTLFTRLGFISRAKSFHVREYESGKLSGRVSLANDTPVRCVEGIAIYRVVGVAPPGSAVVDLAYVNALISSYLKEGDLEMETVGTDPLTGITIKGPVVKSSEVLSE